MKRLGFFGLMVLTGLMVRPVGGQIVGDDVDPALQGSWNTADNSVMALRAPGNLVSLGRADFAQRHSLMIQRSRSGPDITQEAPEVDLGHQLKAQVIETLFDSLNTLLELWLATLDFDVPSGGDSTGLSDLLGTITRPV
jgi:hypothetical protein